MTQIFDETHVYHTISRWPNGQEILTPHLEATMPNEIFWNDEVYYHHSPTPKPDPYGQIGQVVTDPTFLDQIRQISTPRTVEQKFRELDIKVGDRVRLTVKKAPDAGQLEGEVLGLKTRDRGSQIRIKGFDHTGGTKVQGSYSGGQHVWFRVADYTVEVLHRAYRWTADDELLVELVGVSRKRWEDMSEEARKSYRISYASRVERIKKLLADAK